MGCKRKPDSSPFICTDSLSPGRVSRAFPNSAYKSLLNLYPFSSNLSNITRARGKHCRAFRQPSVPPRQPRRSARQHRCTKEAPPCFAKFPSALHVAERGGGAKPSRPRAACRSLEPSGPPARHYWRAVTTATSDPSVQGQPADKHCSLNTRRYVVPIRVLFSSRDPHLALEARCPSRPPPAEPMLASRPPRRTELPAFLPRSHLSPSELFCGSPSCGHRDRGAPRRLGCVPQSVPTLPRERTQRRGAEQLRAHSATTSAGTSAQPGQLSRAARPALHSRAGLRREGARVGMAPSGPARLVRRIPCFKRLTEATDGRAERRSRASAEPQPGGSGAAANAAPCGTCPAVVPEKGCWGFHRARSWAQSIAQRVQL